MIENRIPAHDGSTGLLWADFVAQKMRRVVDGPPEGMLSNVNRSHPIHGRGFTALWLIVCVAAAPAAGFAQAPPRSGTAVPLSRFVPASSRLFITFRKVDDVDEALRRTHAGRLLAMISAGEPGVKPDDLRTIIRRLIGVEPAALPESALPVEIGVVADSLFDLSKAVWLFRVGDEGLIEKWFPAERRRAESGGGPVRTFSTNDGVNVCVRENILAVARHPRARAPLRDVRRLMVLGGGENLEAVAAYRELASYLPARELATVYAAFPRAGTSKGPRAWAWIPPVERLILALYERDGRLDIACRAALRSPAPAAPLRRETIAQFKRLPHTSIGVWALTTDLSQAYARAVAGPSDSALRRYLTLFTGLHGETAPDSLSLKNLGPDVLVIWGQDLAIESAAPQLAVMIRSGAARAMRGNVTTTVQNLIQLLQAVDPVPEEARPAFQLTHHLGTPIVHVPLGRYAEHSAFAVSQLLVHVDPAWAAVDDWLIVATHSRHIQRILDARSGLVPTLESLRDVGEIAAAGSGLSTLGVVQPAYVAQILNQWVRDADAGKVTLLAPDSWLEKDEDAPPTRSLGRFSVFADVDPGTVEVAAVGEEAGDAPLQPKDRIIGIDGQVLSLARPIEDLRRRWAASPARPGPTLRIERDGILQEVTVARALVQPQTTMMGLEPVDALREMAALIGALELATWSINPNDDQRLSARVTLRFVGDAPTSAGTPAP